MVVSASFQTLANLLDECEQSGVEVRRVTPRDGDDLLAGEDLAAEVELAVSLASAAVSTGDAALDDGRLAVRFDVLAPILPADIGGASVTPGETWINDDGTVGVSLAVRTPPAATDRADRSAGVGEMEPVDDADGTDLGDRDIPPFEDPDLLASVYERCDTFAEMTAELGLEVTPETTRRYMIDCGVHEPDSYDTDGGRPAGSTSEETGGTDADGAAGSGEDADGAAVDGEDADGTTVDGGDVDDRPADDTDPGGGDRADPPIVADGLGLPEGTTVDELIGAIRDSNTVYEVSRTMGVERERARDLLADLNLLDLVVGRLAAEDRRQVPREEVVERLRQSTA
ncbi:hypothetical protein BRC83_03680 [Halobacteriales archaeon QS_1_68_17]|nr:MAG: hypothetical protein BRC83_03680 [Halobacteriales archaeon QS_1_68_17]